MRFLFDNNLPPALAGALRLLEKPVLHVRDISSLGGNAPDELIMEYSATHGYVVVTRDLDQIKLPWFKPTLRQLGAAYHFVRAATRKGVEPKLWVLAKIVVKAWDEIERYTDTHKGAFTSIVKPGGGVSNYPV